MNHIVTSIRVKLTNISSKDDELILRRLIRPQRSAVRIAYNRFLEGQPEKEIWRALRETFPLLTGRNLNDAIMQAKGLIRLQRERLPKQISALEKRIQRLNERCRGLDARCRLQERIENLSRRCEDLKRYQANNTIPRAVFGGKKLWLRVSRRDPLARLQWRDRRSNQFYSRGAKNYRGNPHCQLTADENGNLQLSIRVPEKLKMRGKAVSTSAYWLISPIVYSRQYEHLLQQTMVDGQSNAVSYDVRLMRLLQGQYLAFITVKEPVAYREYSSFESLPNWCQSVAGIDLNLNHLAVVVSDCEGQFRHQRTFAYSNLGELPRGKSKWLAGNIATDVIRCLTETGVHALIIEDLDIERRDKLSRFNRRTVPFSYRQLRNFLVRQALRAGMVVKVVNPAYTSWIASQKYSPMLGISIHVGAAFVIARRGLGLQERIPTHIIRKFPQLIQAIENNIDNLKRRSKGKTNDEIEKKIEIRLKWLGRLRKWKSYSPEAGKPWLLWVTLYLVNKNVSGAGAILDEAYQRKESPRLTAL